MADIQIGPPTLYSLGGVAYIGTPDGKWKQLGMVGPMVLSGGRIGPEGTGIPEVVAHEFDLWHRWHTARWHRRHCRICNPAAFAPRCPYGHEYHRRQRARKRGSR